MNYNRKSRAKSLIVWESIKFAAQHSQVFDFEGSIIEGIENFDQQFGGRCTPYYSVRKASYLYELGYLFVERNPRVKHYARELLRILKHRK